MKILTPISGPKPARDKADYVVSISRALDAELHVLHIKAPGAQGGEEALSIFEGASAEGRVKYTGVIKEGSVVDTLSAYAEEVDADLIIMGASAGKVITEWLMADFVVRSKWPMVVIPFGFEGEFDPE